MEHDKYAVYILVLVSIVGLVALISVVTGPGMSDLTGQALRTSLYDSPGDDTIIYNPITEQWQNAVYYPGLYDDPTGKDTFGSDGMDLIVYNPMTRSWVEAVYYPSSGLVIIV